MNDRTPLAPITQLKRDAIPKPPPRPVRPVPDPAPEAAEVEAPAAQQRPRSPRPAATKQDSTGQVRPISLSVPAPLLEEFKRFAKRTETSHANLLMDAIAAHHDDLTDLVVQARPAPTSDGLFVRDTPRKAEPLSTLSIRIRAANVEAIDRLVDTSGAASRSHLCTAAMTAYLGHAARGSEA